MPDLQEQIRRVDLRTEVVVPEMVTGVQEDLKKLAGFVERAKDLADRLSKPAQGLGSLPGFLRGQATLLAEMITNIEDESSKLAKTMLGTSDGPKVEIIIQDGKRLPEKAAS